MACCTVLYPLGGDTAQKQTRNRSSTNFETSEIAKSSFQKGWQFNQKNQQENIRKWKCQRKNKSNETWKRKGHWCTWMVKMPLAASVCRWISICAVSPPAVINLWRSFSRASLPFEISSLMNTWWDEGHPRNPWKQTVDVTGKWQASLALEHGGLCPKQSLLPLSLSTMIWQRCPEVSSSQPGTHVCRSYLHRSGLRQHSDDPFYQYCGHV